MESGGSGPAPSLRKGREKTMSLMQFGPFGDPFRQMDRLTSQLMSGTRTPMAMPMDVWQSGDGYHVCLDLPGVDPGSVEVTAERNMLTVRAERKPEFSEGDQVLVAERSQGSFTRQLQLGDAVDAQHVQASYARQRQLGDGGAPQHVRASYANGGLCLPTPPAPQSHPRRIEIQQGQA